MLLLGRGLSFQTLHARQGRQRPIRALVLIDATCAVVSRHREPALKVCVDVFRPAGLTATRPVMSNIDRARGFPSPNLIEGFSRFFVLQGSFLPVIAPLLVSVDNRILWIHDFPFPG